MLYRLILLTLFSLFSFQMMGQIVLDNASFEGTPSDATIPSGWFSATKGTTPDILPGYWGVYEEPEDGETYMGLIVRPDGSYESIWQRLKQKLNKDDCYTLSFDAAHSITYTGYNDPIHLRIWIGSKKSRRDQMIYSSPLIESEEWQHFKVDFKPEKNMRYIIIEAFREAEGRSFKGNLLIDNLSPIFNCNKA